MQRKWTERSARSSGSAGRVARVLRGGRAAAALAALAALATWSAAAAMAQGTRAVVPGSQGSGSTETCFWGRPAADIGPQAELNEIGRRSLGPDTNVAYYGTQFELPAGATVTLHGEYPHARFMSLTSYVVVGGEPGNVASALSDQEIAPDAGSVNPFAPGASRTAPTRRWTVTISGDTKPPIDAPNTLYVGQEGDTGQTQHVEILYRVYRTDAGYDDDGGVAPPIPTYNPASGEPTTSEGEACSALSVIPGWENFNSSNVGLPEATYKALRGPYYPEDAFGKEHEFANGVSVHPAQTVPKWEKYFNNQLEVGALYRGTVLEPRIAELPTSSKPGFWATPSNSYMLAYVDRRIGPNPSGENIVVLRGKMPTHPDTYEGNPVSEDGSTQMRYWSLSNYSAIAKPTLLEPESASLFDQEVPTNATGEYTIVISLPQDRPANARPGCGVAWMNWGTAGDDLGDPYLDLLMVRNQESNPTFEHSIEKVQRPGEEEAVLGAYYPRGEYTDKEQFEATASCAPAAPGAPSATSGQNPNRGSFTLGWSASGEAEEVEGVTYTLEHKSSLGGWETVASGLPSPEYTFAGAGQEGEGTWTYRVKASNEGHESAWSSESAQIKVDRAAAPAPTALVSRAPDYAGGGGWYRGGVEVSFMSNGAGVLPDGSEGAALEASSLTPSQNLDTSGTHTVCGTVEDVLGVKSAPGCVTVQVDASAPIVSISCPATAILDEAGVTADWTASDAYSGLAGASSGSVAIVTNTLGVHEVASSATSNVGNKGSASCTTGVVYAFSRLLPSSGRKVRAEHAVNVTFRLMDALGYVTDGAATLEIAPTSGAGAGVYQPATSDVNSGDLFAARAHGKYAYSLSTAGLAKGRWSLRINVNDGTTHTTAITIT